MAYCCCSFTLTPVFINCNNKSFKFKCRAETLLNNEKKEKMNKKKIVIVGSGWAGLGAAHHLCNQDFDVTVLDGENGFGHPDDVTMQSFWSPYRNIFSLVDELGIKPFTTWMKLAQYSGQRLEVEFPIFRDQPQLPTPLGTFLYTRFARLPFPDRLTSLPLMAAAIDFDNTDSAWRKYDPITARELFKQVGVSKTLYEDVFRPLLSVGLFAPAELCSAAATLGLLCYTILSHQKDFDSVWCRGTVREMIFEPWMDSMRIKGCEFLDSGNVTDFVINEETRTITQVICGQQTYDADAVIMAVGVSMLQEILKNSAALRTEEFLKVLNLASIDALSIKLHFDRKVIIPNACNACSSSNDDSFGWTFFDLNKIHDEYKNDQATVIQADFYNAKDMLLLEDEIIVEKVVSEISKRVKDLDSATVINSEIKRSPKSLTRFFPGSYKNMPRSATAFPNLFMAGDWIITRHGSWSQEKSYVTGLEAANRVIDRLEEGEFAKIIPVEEDEPHIEALRNLNRNLNELRSQIPFSNYFL